jgi:hypothetical protein
VAGHDPVEQVQAPRRRHPVAGRGPLPASFGGIGIGVMLAAIAGFRIVCTEVLDETRSRGLDA